MIVSGGRWWSRASGSRGNARTLITEDCASLKRGPNKLLYEYSLCTIRIYDRIYTFVVALSVSITGYVCACCASRRLCPFRSKAVDKNLRTLTPRASLDPRTRLLLSCRAECQAS